MKKITVFITLFALFVAASCKKEEKKTTPDPKQPVSFGNWTIDGKTYNAIVANASGSHAGFVDDGSTNTIGFLFQSLPSASGVYNVSDNIPLGQKEVTIMVTHRLPYMDGFTEGGTVNVTVADGKVHLKCSGIKLIKQDEMGDTIGIGTFSADVYY